jgi:hypothetical protein
MKARSDLPGRLKASGSGLGEASQTEIDLRAAELAQIDGRDTFNDEDLVRAAEELGARRRIESEMGACDEAAEDLGRRTPRTPLENDCNLGEQLTEQGMADADHDRRVAASDDEGEA